MMRPPRAGLSAQWLTGLAYYGKYINAGFPRRSLGSNPITTRWK